MDAKSLEYKMAMDSIGFAAQMLTTQVDTFAALIKAERDIHNSLHITDPTLYIKAINSKNLARQVKLAKAALAFVVAVQEVKADLLTVGDVPE
jgi:hypothetical protein